MPILPPKPEPKLVSRPLPISIAGVQADPKTGSSGSGIHIEIGGKLAKGGQKVPRMASAMKIHPAVSMPERSQNILQVPIAPATFTNAQVLQQKYFFCKKMN